MQSAFIITDKTNKPYAVVGILAGGTEFYPIAESATSWASWMKEEFAAKKITKQQLIVTLDNSMSVDGPMPANRANKPKLDELLRQSKRPAETEQTAIVPEEKNAELVPVISLLDVRIDNMENHDWRNTVNFKAKSFVADVNKSTFAYEVKRTRASWDPSLAIPGTERRGGWRCPPGTRYGGQITDRFGRNCGWGVSRRLANEISDLGERLENVGDKRRERRVARRNERMVRRLAGGGRVERAARGIGDALDITGRDGGAEAPRKPRGAGLVERAAGRVAEVLDSAPPSGRGNRNRRGPAARERNRGGLLERAAGRLAEVLDSEDSVKPAPRRPRPAAPNARPARPRQPRRPRTEPSDDPYVNNLRQMSDTDLEQQWRDAKRNVDNLRNAQDRPRSDGQIGMLPVSVQRAAAQRRLEKVQEELNRRGMRAPIGDPNAPGGRRVPRQPRRIEIDNVSKTPVPAGVPKANETLKQYKRRKYNEHQQRVREIQEQGGDAGLLRYEEWEQFHGPIVEENWNRAQARNGGRGARRAATNAGAARTATRRPNPADAPDAAQPPRRERIPFRRYQNQRALKSGAAAWRKIDAIDRDMNNLEMRQLDVVEYNGKFYVVNGPEIDAAVDAGARRVPRPSQGGNPPARPSAVTPPGAPTPPSRPPSPRGTGRAAPLNKAEDRHDTKMPRLANDDGSIKVVPIGNAGITTKTEALAFQGSISDVPDAFLKDVMNARSANIVTLNSVLGMNNASASDLQRTIMRARTDPSLLSAQDKQKLKQLKDSGFPFFAVQGGSITAPTFYLRIADDGSIDGRGYIFKNEDRHAAGRGQHGELVGVELAERLGFAHGAPRVIPQNGSVALLIELGPNFAKGHARDFGIQDADQELGGASQLGHAIVNMLLASGDRHGRNGMNFAGNGALPIDFGRAFEKMKTDQSPEKMLRYMQSSLRGLDSDFMRGYKRELAALRNSGTARERAIEQINERIKQDLQSWQAAAQAMMDDGTYDGLRALVPNASSGDSLWQAVASRKRALQDRITLLGSPEFIALISQQVV